MSFLTCFICLSSHFWYYVVIYDRREVSGKGFDESGKGFREMGKIDGYFIFKRQKKGRNTMSRPQSKKYKIVCSIYVSGLSPCVRMENKPYKLRIKLILFVGSAMCLRCFDRYSFFHPLVRKWFG